MTKKGIRVAVIFEPERSRPKVLWFDLNCEQAKVIDGVEIHKLKDITDV